ncbi:MAG: helix-turn-helix domain-containing protein [Phycisphaerae bacterium]|nr:helix-turn-helix domain-containing protein [Phycisphaerae bacterium]
MGLGDILRQRRQRLGMTQDQVAQRAGISKPYLSNVETGRARPPSDGVLRALEEALNCTPGDLMKVAHLERTPVDVREQHELLSAEVVKLRRVLKGLMDRAEGGTLEQAGVAGLFDGDEAPVAPSTAGAAVPIINTVSAGYPQQFTDLDYPVGAAEEYIRCPDLHDPHAFAVRVVGDPMAPRYRQGDIVVFSPGTVAENGQDCFVRFAGEGGTTFKRVYTDTPETIRLQPLNDAYPPDTCPRERITGCWPAVCRIEHLDR